jgi:glycosyltransferase involved in cell wall biosynthesis
VLKATAVLRAGRDDVVLVKVGKRLTREQRELAEKLGVADCVRELGVLSGEELLTVYWASDLLLFPSWWEGFGWPPLEAMASGTAVVCSDRGALGEVVRGAALVVNPEEPESIADGVARVLGDEGLRRSLVESGLRRAGEFTWERAAAQTFRVYEEVAG